MAGRRAGLVRHRARLVGLFLLRLMICREAAAIREELATVASQRTPWPEPRGSSIYKSALSVRIFRLNRL